MTLAEFLLARIAEDAERADFNPDTEPWMSYRVGHSDHCDYPGDMPGYCTCRARDRALADCEAKRQLLEWLGVGPLTLPGEEGYAVRLLALPYAEHPDYRDEWKP